MDNNNRLIALDVFRGLTITAMILVNNPGSWSHVYSPLLHADWDGWTVTDLIFPFFIFIVGVALSYSLGGLPEHNGGRNKIVKKAILRSIKLFSLGLFLALFYYDFSSADFNWFEERLTTVRIMGVLQRIALVYLLSVFIVLMFNKNKLIYVSLGILVFYTLITLFIPYSDQLGTIYVGLFEKGNSLGAWIDHHVLGINHVYYKTTQPFSSDPEGLLSTLPAISTCLRGVITGNYLRRPSNNGDLLERVKWLVIVGLAGIIFGLLLSSVIAINKFFWSASYVLLTSGFASFTLGLLIFLIDFKHYKKWSFPFIVFGANSILFFMFSGVMARIMMMVSVDSEGQSDSLKSWIYNFLETFFSEPKNASLTFALCFLVFSYAIMLSLYKKKHHLESLAYACKVKIRFKIIHPRQPIHFRSVR